MRYKRITEYVDAVQFTGDNFDELSECLKIPNIRNYYVEDTLFLPPLRDGILQKVNIGNFIIYDDVLGIDIYPEKIFIQNYVRDEE